MSWTDAERRRFEEGVIERLADAGVPCEPIAGSLRVTLGGSIASGTCALVTWAADGVGPIVHRRAQLDAGDLGAILHNAQEKLIGSEGAGG